MKSNAFSIYPNYLTLTCPPDSVLKSKISFRKFQFGNLKAKISYLNTINLTTTYNVLHPGCRCTEFVCRGVVLDDASCKVYAAPGNATQGELICVPQDLVLADYTHNVTEDVVHFAACRQYYQMTACTNVRDTPRFSQDKNNFSNLPSL